MRSTVASEEGSRRRGRRRMIRKVVGSLGFVILLYALATSSGEVMRNRRLLEGMKESCNAVINTIPGAELESSQLQVQRVRDIQAQVSSQGSDMLYLTIVVLASAALGGISASAGSIWMKK